MKKILFLLFIGLIFTQIPLEAQTPALNSFYYKYKSKKDVFNITVPGWLARFGLAVSGERSELGDMERQLIKKVRRVRLMVSENPGLVTSEALKELRGKILKKDDFEELLYIRDGDEQVHFFIREKKGKVRNLLVLVNEVDEFVMISINANIELEELQPYADEMLAEMDIDI